MKQGIKHQIKTTAALALICSALGACSTSTGGNSWHDPEYQHLRQITKQQMLYKAQQDAITHSSGM